LTDVYETAQTLSEYLLFHYGTEAEILPYDFGPKRALNFPIRCVGNLIDGAAIADGGQAIDHAYDLGCAVGRSTFELGRYARHVRGYDLSSAFIGAANHLLDRGRIETEMMIEGELTERVEIRAPDVPVDADIGFEVGDAVTLAEELPPVDLVLAANLLCRLPTPEIFLKSLARLVKPGGQLLLVTPFTWLEAFTPHAAWPRNAEGQAIPGAAWIEDVLRSGFKLEHAEDMPFLIREHARKFQWTVSAGTRWRRLS